MLNFDMAQATEPIYNAHYLSDCFNSAVWQRGAIRMFLADEVNLFMIKFFELRPSCSALKHFLFRL